MLADMGLVTGNTLYFAGYTVNMLNSNSSSYTDYANGRKLYTAISASHMSANANVP
jgi:hypothetical protein